MASHRKPKQRSLTGTTARTAATLAMAGAASVTAFGETGHADPQLSANEVKTQVDALYQQAEQATEQYNGAKEAADTARADVTRLQDEMARKTARLNTTRDEIGSIAAAQYRSGGIDPSMQLALDSTPDTYLERAGILSQVTGRQAQALRTLGEQQQAVKQTHDAADAKLATLRDAQTKLAEHKRTIETKLHAAQALLDRLTAAQHAAVNNSGHGSASAPAHADRSADRVPIAPGDIKAPSVRAAQAVAFAYGALGLPYVWGATGPSAYDCSGLTQAAWKAAGVSLPRTTYTQINVGQRVSESQLQPGDLVFFYSGISHVGLYIGNGQMIHAPHPGAPVRIAPVNEMPFAGASRPS
ncbi:NlpC/P60 family protein [Streptomyces sp. H10-C2]|uniref:C40 family peptidase n=1 Tax=unclassified Streptomyces TaxID=2593676 RepID=UPI0024BBA6A7|nr:MULTISPECIES: NlpC/P60 family protein [unclassified Streptomyces]MDJ0340574.1 NlpC/P60 family protein [Streptomyces sp. PH10-H1]MDJ0370222.1 NlpC/P60 family protein [Streptomyces sp. H10-C2]